MIEIPKELLKIMEILSTIGMFAIVDFIMFNIIQPIYCYIKQKRNNKNKCFFWTCENWHNCKYNDTNKEEKKLQKLKKKYTRTIKKDNNHIYCEVKNYKKLHNELERMKGE